jgi:hypothetical protein
MNDDVFIFVLMIVGISIIGGIVNNYIRVKHGYAPLDRKARRHAQGDSPDAERKITLLSSENERLTGQISRLEERIAVLERIATDPAERVSREIDALR